jgi:hypothetical protein
MCSRPPTGTGDQKRQAHPFQERFSEISASPSVDPGPEFSSNPLRGARPAPLSQPIPATANRQRSFSRRRFQPPLTGCRRSPKRGPPARVAGANAWNGKLDTRPSAATTVRRPRSPTLLSKMTKGTVPPSGMRPPQGHSFRPVRHATPRPIPLHQSGRLPDPGRHVASCFPRLKPASFRFLYLLDPAPGKYRGPSCLSAPRRFWRPGRSCARHLERAAEK